MDKIVEYSVLYLHKIIFMTSVDKIIQNKEVCILKNNMHMCLLSIF